MNYVYSTLATDMEYCEYGQSVNEIPQISRRVTINGGAGVANKNFITPEGVVTSVSDADIEVLQGSSIFKAHEKAGFVRIEKKKVDIEKVVADMTGRDTSAPLVDADFSADPQADGITVKTGAPE